MRWADAIAIGPKTITVIEAKLRASEFLKALGELQLYMHLVKHTPEFARLRDKDVAGRLVIPFEDPALILIARRNNIDVAIFKPTFWNEYLAAIQPRQARPIRPEEARLLEGE
jgi:hypothetical protein